MAFDPVTLLTISILVLAAVGGLLIQSARGDRDGRALLCWGVSYLLAALGFALLLAAPTDVNAFFRMTGNIVILLAYGLAWAAARIFNRREPRLEMLVAGVVVWLVVAAVLNPGVGPRIFLASVLLAGYSFATAFELRSGQQGNVQAQRWATWVFLAHGGFFVARAIAALASGLAPWGPATTQLWAALSGVETMLFVALFGCIAVAMSRERSVNLHRRHALEDMLTGVGNRRALFQSGPALLSSARAVGQQAALLLMDLDHFKQVNDKHGHETGDRLLMAFARMAREALPPESLLCRIGGEEFAAVLPFGHAEHARTVAEELRMLFARSAITGPHGPVSTTVSVGIASTGDETDDIKRLLARADFHLYRAKETGRNRVEDDGAERPDGSSPRRSAA